jgi:hypothetical protein
LESQDALCDVRGDVHRFEFGERKIVGADVLKRQLEDAGMTVGSDPDADNRVLVGDGDPDSSSV